MGVYWMMYYVYMCYTDPSTTPTSCSPFSIATDPNHIVLGPAIVRRLWPPAHGHERRTRVSHC